MRSSRDSLYASMPDVHWTLYPLTPSTGVQLTRRAPYFGSTETPVTASGMLNWASAGLLAAASAQRPTIKAAASAPILKAGDRCANRRTMKSFTSSTSCGSIGGRTRLGWSGLRRGVALDDVSPFHRTRTTHDRPSDPDAR